MGSLQARLLLAASLVLVVFIVLCGWGLENAFRNSAQAAQKERMQGMVYALLGAADEDERGLLTFNPAGLPEPRLRQPQSGLEAVLLDEGGRALWYSPSAASSLPDIVTPNVGIAVLGRVGEDGPFTLSFGLRWIGSDYEAKRYTMLLMEDPENYDEQLGIFRRTLWLSLLGSAAALLAALLLVQRWGLSPLGRLAGELREIERGKREQIDNPHARELAPLTGALNAMIRSERSQQVRYRNALGDLAHSLKTPLAILRGVSDSLPASERAPIDEQVGRMQDIVNHQLARAATAGRRVLARPVALAPIAHKVAQAVAKVYAEKSLRFVLEVPEELRVRADSGDLYELVGNLLDNAAKWARTAVQISATNAGRGFRLQVEDDGPGFPEGAERLLERGVRADTTTDGQGLGLAAVADMVKLYGGSVELGRSPSLGGGSVSLQILT